MNPRRILLWAGLVLLGLSAACGGRHPRYNAELQSHGPFPVNGGLVYLNHTLGELVRIAPRGDRPKTERVFVAENPIRLNEVLGGELLAVLHDRPDRPGVSLLGAATLREEAWLPLGEQFDQMAVSPSGRFGVAHFSGESPPSGGIRNMNQIQVLDFQDGRVQAPLALQTGGLSPRGIDFLPAGSGEFDDIAVVLVDNGLVFVDMRDPGALPLWVRFTNAPGGLAVPAEVVFGSFSYADGGYLFVRLQGSDDVLSVHLLRESGRLQRTINFLNTPVGSRPMDLMVLAGSRFVDKVFVVYGSSPGDSRGAVAILDANAIQTDEKYFSLDLPVQRAVALRGTDGRELVAVFSPDSSTSRMSVIDPVSGEVEEVQFQDRFDGVAVPEEGACLVVFHPTLSQTATPGMRVVRMEPQATSGRLTHRIATYSLDARLAAFAFANDRRTMLAALQNETDTFQLDLETGGYGSLELDRRPVATGLVPGTGWSWFVHQHPLGGLTLVPLDHFDRGHAIMLEGFILQGLVDPEGGGGS